MRWLLLFQSTLSVRRATILLAAVVDVMLFQSTLSVRRATRQVDHAAIAHDISIHALRKESDLNESSIILMQHISIHALRKESDTTSFCKAISPMNFNPRSP